MTSPILLAYALNPQGAQPLEGDMLTHAIAANQTVWVHLKALSAEAKPWLHRFLGEEEALAIRSLLTAKSRPHAEVVGKGLLLVLRGVNLNPHAHASDMVSLRIWIQDQLIITLERRPVQAIQDLQHQIEAQHPPYTACEFIPALIDCLFNNLEPVLHTLDYEINRMETTHLQFVGTQANGQIPDLRKETLVFRRHLNAEREALKTLLQSEHPLFQHHKSRKLLKEQLNRLTHYVEDLEMIQERSQIVQDELRHRLNDRINTSNYWLSLASAVSIPLMFMTGLWGMNIDTGIPLSRTPYGFWLVAGISILMSSIFFLWIKQQNKM
jgi:zinc transporter